MIVNDVIIKLPRNRLKDVTQNMNREVVFNDAILRITSIKYDYSKGL